MHRTLKPRGLLLDIHPLGDDFPVLAGERGIGFVDTRKFRGILEAMNDCVEQTVAEGLFEAEGAGLRTATSRPGAVGRDRATDYQVPSQGALTAAADLLRILGEAPEFGDRLWAVVFGPEHASALGPVRVFEAAQDVHTPRRRPS
jgi:hypothetical protein